MNEDKLRRMDSHVHNCTYHPPTAEETKAHHEAIRQMAIKAGESIMSHTPLGREQSVALTKIEEAMFWANAGIARNHYKGD